MSTLKATNLQNASSATTNIALDTSGNVTVGGGITASSGTVVMSSPYTMRNKIINGAMVIDQRNAGASQTITGGASTLAFNCDRWQVRSAGANATVQQISTNNLYRMRFTGAASVSAVAAQQSIEALNCVDLAGGSATLSLVASSTSLTSLTLEAYYANTTNSFGTWGSPTVTSISSTSITISSTESTFSWTFSVPSAATTGIQIRITGGSLGASQTLTIGNVQLERGTVATPFEYRNYQQELAMCQRYYQLSNNFLGVGTSATTVNGMISYPVTMRTSPSVGLTGVFNVSDYYVADYTQSSAGISLFNATPTGSAVSLTNFSGITTGRLTFARLANSNTITLSAEL